MGFFVIIFLRVQGKGSLVRCGEPEPLGYAVKTPAI